jgi:hypothetical protein
MARRESCHSSCAQKLQPWTNDHLGATSITSADGQRTISEYPEIIIMRVQYHTNLAPEKHNSEALSDKRTDHKSVPGAILCSMY